ncbi:class I SAM-dependent methyltransferase [Enemella sp. A6]|uniref:class I SAM-dependent methyltransferase n=1 Tax=Enemella sp. A6 TaxID=3440152 RepID=UPI003EBD3DDA
MTLLDRISGYDLGMVVLDRPFLRSGRRWVCRRAHGHTLEVAIGTGLNLPHYADEVTLTGLELNPDLARHARRRADRLGRGLELTVGDAMALPHADGSFDAVVCTFALCGVGSPERTIDEMLRVLKPGGDLLLSDHVRARPRWLRGLQRLLEAVTVPLAGEYWTRRPLAILRQRGVTIVDTRARGFGMLESVHARKAG